MVWVVIVVTGRFNIWGMSRRQGCALAPRSLQIPPEALSQGLLERRWLSLLRNAETTRVLSRKGKYLGPVFLGFTGGSAGKESACNAGDLGSMLGLGGSPGEGSGCPLQYSGLENSGLCGPRAQDCHTTHLSRTGFPFSHFVRACLLCL